MLCMDRTRLVRNEHGVAIGRMARSYWPPLGMGFLHGEACARAVPMQSLPDC